MAVLNEAFDVNSAPERKGFDLIPPNTQAGATIIENEIRNTKAGGLDLALKFEILDGPHEGRKIFQRVTWTHPTSTTAVEIGRAFMGELCKSLGHTGLLRDLDVLNNKPVRITVGIEKDKSGQYGDRNVIAKTAPYRTGGAPQTSQPPAGTRPPQTGVNTAPAGAPQGRVQDVSEGSYGATNMDEIPF